MSQVTSAEVPSGSGLSVRQAINAVLAALMSHNSGSSAPPNPVPGQFWLDTSNGEIKVRDTANASWVALIDGIAGLRYDAPQSRSAAEKAQARANAGLGSVATENTVPLSKGGTGGQTAAEARANMQAPLSPTAGGWRRDYFTAGQVVVLPSGGTWAFFYIRRLNDGTINAIDGAVSAGGTNLLTLGPTEACHILVWKVQ